MKKITINMLSSADKVDGQGVGSAYLEQVSLVKEGAKELFDVRINDKKDADIIHHHTVDLQNYIRMNRTKGVNVAYVHFLPTTLDGSIKLPKPIFSVFKKYVVNFYNKANIEKTDEEEHGDNYKIIEEWIEQNCKDDNEEINKILNWEYKYEESTKIEGKASVTEIAKGSRKELKEIETKPKFLEETENLSKAEIGTLTHLIMQKLNFKEDYDKPKVINLL